MKNTVFIAALAAAAALSTPALARVEGHFGQAKMTLDEKTGKYCLKRAVPGSLIPLVTCRSIEGWADAGLTITRKSSTQLAQR